MAKRGRPRFPDILTPREWEVLALLREGLSNDQIAGRLDITERTARFHVSEILSKLGVSTRQEAAAWQPEERRPWWEIALAPLSLLRGHRWLASAVGVATMTAAVAGVALLLWGIMRTNGNRAETTTAPAVIATPRACPTPGGSAIIDYVDFVKFNGISYMANGGPRDLSRLKLGQVIARVECNISAVGDPSYRTQDGDAALLAPGTAIYAIDRYNTRFRLATTRDGNLRLYEAFNNPAAKTGRDLLDIAGRVQYISINSDYPQTLAEIRDATVVNRLASLGMAAPTTTRSLQAEGQQYFVGFHLNDGTVVSRAYWPSTGMLWPSIVLPPAFRDAVEAALATASP